jgi:hypothetical protein
MARSRTLAAVALAAALLGVGAPSASASVPGCLVDGATLTWGFKESFRAYIDGDIANGEWTTADGATYETPEFTWHDGSGVYDPQDGTGLIRFPGSVRFTGHDGLLDTTIANPQIRLDGGSAMLLLDVAGITMDGDPTDLTAVEFVALPVAHVVGDDAVRTVDAATELTGDGAIAFPNYAAGEAFDPVELSLPVGKLCPTSVSAPGGDDTAADDSQTVVFSILGGGIVVAAAAAVVVATRRRRRA